MDFLTFFQGNLGPPQGLVKRYVFEGFPKEHQGQNQTRNQAWEQRCRPARPFNPLQAPVSCGFGALCDFISTVVSSGASSAKELNDMMDERFEEMDLQEFVSQMTAAFPCFMRFVVTHLFKDIASGDLAATGRMLVRLTLFQALSVGLETILLTGIIGKVAFRIGA